MPKIGVFWFYKGTVIGRAIEIAAGEEGPVGSIDSPDNHTDLWENDPTLLKGFPELRQEEYFSIPRGRVFWKKRSDSAKVLMDSVLFQQKIKDKILDFFDLLTCRVQWRKDLHYTTSQQDLSKLFDDEDW